MNLLEILGQALLRVVMAFIQVAESAIRLFQTDLRFALERAGVKGDVATLLIALVPVLFLVAVIRLMGGIIRLILAVALILVLLEILVPPILSHLR